MIESQDELVKSDQEQSLTPTAHPSVVRMDAPLGLPKIIPFDLLCKCGDEVWIENDGMIYRLRKTKQGKLILTK